MVVLLASFWSLLALSLLALSVSFGVIAAVWWILLVVLSHVLPDMTTGYFRAPPQEEQLRLMQRGVLASLLALVPAVGLGFLGPPQTNAKPGMLRV